MNDYMGNAAGFLIESLFSLYMMAVLLRFMLQLARADFYNPISQFLVKVTNPPLKPLRRIIPGVGGIDIASIVLLFVLQVTKLALLGLVGGVAFAVPGLALMSLGELIGMVLNLYMVTIIVQVILSWVGPGTPSPLTGILYALNEPVMRPARRILPAMGGIDLSPIVVFLAIGLLKILLVEPLLVMGRSLA